MNRLILALFPEGTRKLIVSLLGLALGIGIDKFGGGLTENMETIIISIVAMFTTGNVVEHIVGLFKQKFDLQFQMASSEDEAQLQSVPEVRDITVEDLAQSMQQGFNEFHNRFAEVDKQISLQTQNIQQLVQIINQLRGGKAQQQQG